MHGLQFHPPQTTAAASSRRGTCLILPIAGGSLTQNPGKIGPLIQAVRKVTSAPTHFWDRGARWFVAKFYGLGQLVKNYSVFFGGDSLAPCDKAGFDAVPGKSLAVEGNSRLHDLEGRTEVTSSMTARGC